MLLLIVLVLVVVLRTSAATPLVQGSREDEALTASLDLLLGTIT